MELKKELEKLKLYINDTDVNKFKEQYEFLEKNFTSEAEIKQIGQFIESAIDKHVEEGNKSFDDLKLKIQLIENKEIIPLSYIARNYFKKSKNWIYQRVNGYQVNGKTSKFTDSEIEKFNFALQDISKRLGSIAIH
jgi:hypothetical protein